MNNKTCIRPISQGIEFVGYRVWSGRVVLRKSTTLRIKRSLKGVREAYANGEISFRRATDTFKSYIGMLSHTDSQAFVDKLYADMVFQRAEGRDDEEAEEREFVSVLPLEVWDLYDDFGGVQYELQEIWQV